jgi:mannose-6-phosphate isomerase-like protein (cupin superfamily)
MSQQRSTALSMEQVWWRSRGVAHRLHPGISVFIPADAWHRTTNTGAEPFRFLFPTQSFEEVEYHFDRSWAEAVQPMKIPRPKL